MNKLLIGLFVQLLVTPLAFAEWVDTAGHEVLFIEMEDTTQLEVLDWGGDSTPTLFLLAGMASNAHTYDEFATHFTDEFRVVALSRIGHGYSEPPKNDDFSIERLASDIVRTLDSLGIEKAIFAGHSFAGFELTYLGKHFPERVNGLIYIDAVQAYEYEPEVGEHCPDVAQASIDLFKYKESFYNTQRVRDDEGNYLPFADFNTLNELFEYDRVTPDYRGITAPAIAINHLPEQTEDLLLGAGEPRQPCFEALNKMNYLGVARFVSQMENADVAAIQRSQHTIHMVTPYKLAAIMKNWIPREITTSQ
ncbi:MAG: alpha/beta hydrolase [Firmicutes bacterium]|nr:alpha/beta hydrolase [Bacillota bacterium]